MFIFNLADSQADPQEGSQGDMQGYPPSGPQAGKICLWQAYRIEIDIIITHIMSWLDHVELTKICQLP